ncbi:hypothetical protein Y032_0305g1961 [Ancylostoma ceylanicum]|uniref:Uncharacterized protein n=1 Tax=Ancylostoma ceylanicum TaxID=53326 RepID=A0A016S389_9BILA|nr:hypothetical protein Y032_0305g1961 [Ancylostoma ceylanicum]
MKPRIDARFVHKGNSIKNVNSLQRNVKLATVLVNLSCSREYHPCGLPHRTTYATRQTGCTPLLSSGELTTFFV